VTGLAFRASRRSFLSAAEPTMSVRAKRGLGKLLCHVAFAYRSCSGSCACKTGCKDDRCNCRKAKRPCTIVCACAGACNNECIVSCSKPMSELLLPVNIGSAGVAGLVDSFDSVGLHGAQYKWSGKKPTLRPSLLTASWLCRLIAADKCNCSICIHCL
jgi:hypothetical protein